MEQRVEPCVEPRVEPRVERRPREVNAVRGRRLDAAPALGPADDSAR